MKNVFGCLVSLSALGLASAAWAGEGAGQWHVAAGATLGWLGDSPQATANAPFPGSTLLSENLGETGWGGYAAVGFRPLAPIRIEAEIGRTENDSDAFVITSPFTATVPQDGEIDIWRFMANVYYDFGSAGARLRPYVGVGAGAAHVDLFRFAATAAAPNAPFVHYDDSETGFAWQAMGGVALRVRPHLALTGQYRWFDAGSIDYVTSIGQSATIEIDGHHVDFGLRYEF